VVASISSVHSERSIRWLRPGHRAASRREEDDDDANQYQPGGLGRLDGLRRLGCGQVGFLSFFFCFFLFYF
jgi:hypothetical protein